MTHVKICGVTNTGDALMCVSVGASAIGINLVPSSPRRVDEATARAIADAIRGRAESVLVVADRSGDEMSALLERCGADCLQLHGDESPETLARLLPRAYKALRIRDSHDVKRAEQYGGDYILCDAYVPGVLGGTAKTFEWALVSELARTRKLTLAGGLDSDNVRRAIMVCLPFCVDVATGVESAPGKKDPRKVEAFINAVRGV